MDAFACFRFYENNSAGGKVKNRGPKPETRDVYVVHDPERSACKVGVSNNAEGRFTNLQTGSSVDLTLTHVEKVDYALGTKVERTARRILVENGRPKTREWIGRCDPDEAREAVKTAHEIERGRNHDLSSRSGKK